ncbi:hypothetical protein U9M48_006936 [Paspalum notatum var. saurae]|uniref:SHSP domain-containing protein n=1 Tax=Paspalum notatum var. saurae TaxID=547442 RepID=A0AAQ3PQL5_PASNO
MSLIHRGNAFDPFSLDLWDPFQGFPFGSGSGSSSDADLTAAFAGARIDWKETPEAHVFKADVPGLKKEEVKVEVEDGNVLQISGERSKEKEEKTDTWHRVERSSGKFLRRFRLPENAKTEQIRAAMENGVLTVTVPKEEVKKAEPVIWTGLTSGFLASSLGTVTVSTPFSMDALICSVFAFSGSLNRRRNLPLLRSTLCHLSFFSSCSLLRSPLIWRTLPSSISTLTSSFFSPGTSAVNT